MEYCVTNIHNIEPRTLSGMVYMEILCHYFGRWKVGREFEILLTKSGKSEGGQKIVDFSVRYFLNGPFLLPSASHLKK